MQLAVFSAEPTESTETLHLWGWDAMALTTMRAPIADVLAFAKTSPTAVEAIEIAFGDMLRSSMLVARGYPWGVMAGAPEYEKPGYSRLATEVTKTRLRLFQSMFVSRFASENDLGRAMAYLAQRSSCFPPIFLLLNSHLNAKPVCFGF